MNGEVNGSYEDDSLKDDEEDVLSDGEVVATDENTSHTNGEISVPSQENGVEEKMEVDEVSMNNSETLEGDAASHSEPESDIREKDTNDNSNSSDVKTVPPKAQATEEDVIDDSEPEVTDDGVNKGIEMEPKREKLKEEPAKLEVKLVKSAEPTTKAEPYNLLSTIKGVDPSTPMSKELEDLSKIGARGSLEITLVKKDSLNDRPKEDLLEKMDADVLTITDTSKEQPLNLVTPEKLDKRMEDDEEEDDDDEDDDSVVLISSDKSLKKKKPMSVNVTPRRSSRNLNKSKSYSDKESYMEDNNRKSEEDDDDDDVEEIIPVDPLLDDKKRTPKKTTIVVNDTKKLAEIAAGSKQNKGGKKEPTLVIIDTNSILSGKTSLAGIASQAAAGLPQMSITPANRSSGFSMLPVPSPNQYTSKTVQLTPSTTVTQQPPPPPQVLPSVPPALKPILPSLTDDMYVVEAPSFIVPYVYEKPPVVSLKEYVSDMDKILKELDREEREQRKKKEKESKESIEETSKDDEKPEEKEGKEENSVKEEKEDAEEVSEGGEKKLKKKLEDDDELKLDKEKDSRSDTDTDEEGKDSDSSSKKDSDSVEIVGDGSKKKSESYFDNPLGKFFMQIGVNLVQEHVQTDLLRNQKKKRDRDEKNCPPEVHKAINSLLKSLEYTKENNKPFKLELRKCELCNFKTESELVMAHHLETPHMRNYVYRCNFCTLEVRSPHDILFHMEAEHNVRGRLERAPAFHQCPSCPFEDNQKGKLSRHLLSCAKKYKPERNQEPPLDWEPPAKIPRVRGARPGMPGGPLYHSSLVPRGSVPLGRLPPPAGHSLLAPRGRGRPPIYVNRGGGVPLDGRSSPHHKSLPQIRPGGVVFRPGSNAQPPVLLPSPYNNLYQPKGSSPAAAAAAAGATAKLLQQPSISITPLPRQPPPPQPSPSAPVTQPYVAKPGRPPGSSKTTFVICEICDGYIKDLEQLRNHMQWIHKVKIHPKMIYNRPPLNCQKCQFRFFTDQGLERHLLGSHGLVTSSMQEAANKGKDGGRCPVCGRVYQWKLLNHVARDHNMSLKPAHLSYKCTVCTATFGMYKQFESHVYSAHSVVAKRVMDKKPSQSSSSSSSQPSTSSSSTSQRSAEIVNEDSQIEANVDLDSLRKQGIEVTLLRAAGATQSSKTYSNPSNKSMPIKHKIKNNDKSNNTFSVNDSGGESSSDANNPSSSTGGRLLSCKTDIQREKSRIARMKYRLIETPEQRVMRLEKDRIRRANRIKNETPEQKLERQRKDRIQKALSRQIQSKVVRLHGVQKDRIRKHLIKNKKLDFF